MHLFCSRVWIGDLNWVAGQFWSCLGASSCLAVDRFSWSRPWHNLGWLAPCVLSSSILAWACCHGKGRGAKVRGNNCHCHNYWHVIDQNKWQGQVQNQAVEKHTPAGRVAEYTEKVWIQGCMNIGTINLLPPQSPCLLLGWEPWAISSLRRPL